MGDFQRRLMEAQPRGSMTIRCCEFHLSYLLVLQGLLAKEKLSGKE